MSDEEEETATMKERKRYIKSIIKGYETQNQEEREKLKTLRMIQSQLEDDEQAKKSKRERESKLLNEIDTQTEKGNRILDELDGLARQKADELYELARQKAEADLETARLYRETAKMTRDLAKAQRAEWEREREASIKKMKRKGVNVRYEKKENR